MIGAVISEWRKTLIALIIAATVAGLGFAADSRWLTRASFQQWLELQEQRELLAEIRDLEIEINALQAEIAWADDPRKIAALEERIRYLEAEIADLERQL